MKNIGVTANCGKVRAPDVLRKLAAKAAGLDLSVVVDTATAAHLPGFEVVSVSDMAARVDAVVAMGGDGTMLRVIRELGGSSIPVMGVNIGGLGFLTSIAEDDLDRALECLAADEFAVQERSIVECVVMRNGNETERFQALNELLVSCGPSSRIVNLDLEINGDRVTSYLCDGLIVCTPAGSTGHSLSAGGPILMPGSDAFVISLVCPHTLSSRPLVVPNSSEICITPTGNDAELVLVVDGQVGCNLRPGDCVKAYRSRHNANFIRLPGFSYFGVLRQKLHWSGSNV